MSDGELHGQDNASLSLMALSVTSNDQPAQHVPGRRDPGRHATTRLYPGVAVITGMTVSYPPAYVIGQTHVAVVAARRSRPADLLPTVIVCIGVRPVWVIADMERSHRAE